MMKVDRERFLAHGMAISTARHGARGKIRLGVKAGMWYNYRV